MRYRIGDSVQVVKAPNLGAFANMVNEIGLVVNCSRTHLGKYQYGLCFKDEEFVAAYYYEDELELVSRPSLEELLTSEHEKVREYGKAVTFWREHRGPVKL